MPLTTCPDCSKMVSTSATACPHCGRPVSTPARRNTGLTVTVPMDVDGDGIPDIYVTKTLDTTSRSSESDDAQWLSLGRWGWILVLIAAFAFPIAAESANSGKNSGGELALFALLGAAIPGFFWLIGLLCLFEERDKEQKEEKRKKEEEKRKEQELKETEAIRQRERADQRPLIEAAQRMQREVADQLGQRVAESNSIGMQMILIPSGEFWMGELATASGDIAKPVKVTISREFRLGQTVVTQEQWRSVMGTEPWEFKKDVKQGADYPATHVSWHDAVEFCRKLTDLERSVGRLPAVDEYRLPTEAEWEYACRAGTTSKYSFEGDEMRLSEYGWCTANSGERYAHAVGQKEPNAWGLFDMHGNVLEWCGDWYGNSLPGGRDPVGPPLGSTRVRRGGSSASRGRFAPSLSQSFLGFRVARNSVR